jgi:MinD-like ATPase involved in chromosome partitioning or flagellar assembly
MSSNPITVLLAAPTDRVRSWYQVLVNDERFKVLSYTADLAELDDKLVRVAPDALILDAAMFASADALQEMLANFDTTAVYVLIPEEADEQALQQVKRIPAVRAGFRGDLDLAREAAQIYDNVMSLKRAHSEPPPEAPPPQPAPEPQLPRVARQGANSGKVVAFWSATAGGTGRTTLALALSVVAAQRGVDVLLLALSEPAVSAYLRLPRVPNIMAFLSPDEEEKGATAEQVVTCGQEAAFRVVLGPARSRDGLVERGRIKALVRAIQASCELVVIDLPPLTPGGSPWVLEPLKQATDVMLVMPPTVAGIAATMEALMTLEDLGMPGHVHLVLNHRSAGFTLRPKEFRAGVIAVLQYCPDVVAEVKFVSQLPGLMAQGELPASKVLTQMVSPLAKAVGLPKSNPDADAAATRPTSGRGRAGRGRDKGEGKPPGSGLELGRLKVRLTG